MARRHYTTADKQHAVSLYTHRPSGMTVVEVCRATGVPKATLLRWVAEAEKAAPSTTARTGRPPAHVFTAEEENVLRQLRLKHRSLPLAVEAFLSHETCTPASGAFLHRVLDRAAAKGMDPVWPSCLRKAAFISDEMSSSFRGDRARTKLAPSVTRGAFWVDAHGNEVELLPHDIWESDDMSANEPFRHLDPITGEERIGRQMLATTDRMSAAILGLTLIGRERDAYRSEDILDHMLDLIDSFGLPRLWRLERGVWESKGIDGVRLDDARARELGFTGERWEGKRIGGLDGLFRLEHCYSSNGKGGIESTFNHLQNVTAHRSLHIGRERGEFEGAARELRRAHKGQASALAKFWTAQECADAYAACVGEFNSSPKKRSMYRNELLVPNDLLRAHQVAKRVLPASERWRFQPLKQLAVVRKGLITVTVDKVPFQFVAEGAGIWLEQGHRVVIAFHPQHPERGATIVEAEFGPRNREGRAIGTPLFTVQPLDLTPQFDLREPADRDGASHPAKRWNQHVTREFRSIAEAGTKKSHLSDGTRSVTVETGFDRPAEETAPAPAARLELPPREVPASNRRGTKPAPSDDELRRLEEEALAMF